MPVAPTYPGVYIEEIPSGVHTITGVSTSITGFVGVTKRGPINKAKRILSYSDFERKFGGLDANSELSYSVRQFFSNGGSDCYVVRLAKNEVAASRQLNAGANAALLVTAVDSGFSGNDIDIQVTWEPAGTFTLTINYVSSTNAGDRASETFRNLSMNSRDGRFAESVVNGTSALVTVKRNTPAGTISALSPGVSLSAPFVATPAFPTPKTAFDDSHTSFQVLINGQPPVTVQIANASITAGTIAAELGQIAGFIQTQISDALGSTNPAIAGLAVTVVGGTQIQITTTVAGERSSVRVLASPVNDVSSRLKLGYLNGGTETDAIMALRPDEGPAHGRFTTGNIANAGLPNIPATNDSFKISLDGYPLALVTLDGAAPAGSLQARLIDVAGRIQAKVRALKPTNPAYRDFTCTIDDPAAGQKLVLSSGSRGEGSSVVVAAADAKTLDGVLNFAAGATANGRLDKLGSGNEATFGEAEAYNFYIGSRADRKGIYALDGVDLFNLLVLPGITDPGILADAAAYCQEKRAFLIADAPSTATTPDQMSTVISGTALPKSDHAAVYYPWVYIADPLNGGKPKKVAPGGTIAGLYARTDSNRGVWKAPAGTEANLVGVQKADYFLSDLENGTLNPLGVNCIRIFPVFGAVAWGARTLRGADQIASEYKYVPVRRLVLFIEESLYRGSQWAVFEPNDEPLWAQLRLNVGAFMHNLFRQGAFAGKSPREAYFIKCDSETTTQNDVNLGIVNVVVGFAPLKPAEFVIIQIQQMAGQIQV